MTEAPYVRVRLRRAKHNDPFPCITAAMLAVDRMFAASKDGKGLYLTAEEARAMHWCINNIQEEPIGVDWRREVPA